MVLSATPSQHIEARHARVCLKVMRENSFECVHAGVEKTEKVFHERREKENCVIGKLSFGAVKSKNRVVDKRRKFSVQI